MRNKKVFDAALCDWYPYNRDSLEMLICTAFGRIELRI